MEYVTKLKMKHTYDRTRILFYIFSLAAFIKNCYVLRVLSG